MRGLILFSVLFLSFHSLANDHRSDCNQTSLDALNEEVFQIDTIQVPILKKSLKKFSRVIEHSLGYAEFLARKNEDGVEKECNKTGNALEIFDKQINKLLVHGGYFPYYRYRQMSQKCKQRNRVEAAEFLMEKYESLRTYYDNIFGLSDAYTTSFSLLQSMKDKRTGFKTRYQKTCKDYIVD